MPFSGTPTRSESDLTEFYNTNLKRAIESNVTLQFRYVVRRSDDTFDITERIIRDLYEADIVLCDLSGQAANPNVMYELGVRLAVTNKPVILFREASSGNQRIFDIQGFYAFEYSPTRYRELEEHIIEKLRRFESGEEVYSSPILKVLTELPSVVTKVKNDAAIAMLRMIGSSLRATQTGVSVALGEFLVDQGRTLPETGSVMNAILSSPDDFRDLDWSALQFRPTVPPAIQMFLSQPLLHGLLIPTVVDRTVECVSDYYGQYFATDAIWIKPRLSDVFGFVSATSALWIGLSSLADALVTSSSADRQVAINKALEFFEKPLLPAEISRRLRSGSQGPPPSASGGPESA